MKTTHNLTILLAAVSILIFSPATLAATSGDYEYSDNGNSTCTITNYTGPGGDITIPNTLNTLTVTSIADDAFYYCTSLTSITISEAVTTIGNRAFLGCQNMTNISIPDSVTSIGDRAFLGCQNLANITISDYVTFIGDSAFYACASMTAITIDDLNPVYSSIDGVLLSKDQTVLIQCPAGKAGDYSIPSSVTSIADFSFTYCRNLTSVTIPDSVIFIGIYAFESCSGLTNISIGSSVTHIMEWAFYNCSNLTSVTISDSVTSIGEWAFGFCEALTDIYISDGVTSIADDAFSDCYSLTSATIGSGVISIGDRVFAVCTSLTAITVDPGNTAYSSLDGVLFDKNQNTLIGCPQGKAGNYTIPDSVTSIGYGAFEGCYTLTSVTIPNSVTSIGDLAFRYCIGLTSVSIPNSITSIGNYAFKSCRNLTSVIIGNSVTFIGDYAFQYCSDLISVYFKGDAPTLGSSVFTGVQAIAYYLPGTTGWGPTYGGLPTEPWQLLPADINIDGDVNYFDFAIFTLAWQSSLGDPDYDPYCDIVADDVIDVKDLQVFADNWLGRYTIADFSFDGRVNFDDFAVLYRSWLTDDPTIDIYPVGNPDGSVDLGELLILADLWLQ